MKKYEELDITDPFIFAKVMSEKGESYDILVKNKAPLNALVTGDFVFMNALKRHKFIYVIYK